MTQCNWSTSFCLWKVTFWKNVSGVYTADPRQVPEAFPINSRFMSDLKRVDECFFFVGFLLSIFFKTIANEYISIMYIYIYIIIYMCTVDMCCLLFFSSKAYKVSFFVGSTGDLSSWGHAGSWMTRVHHEDLHFVLLSMEYWHVFFGDFRWSQNSWV